MRSDLHADVLVVGSGAGGAVTAAVLAEAGRDVLVLEDGPAIDRSDIEPFSIDEMRTMYRNGGLTVALGRPPISYVEGRCVGGSTEINSGLFHRPPPQILERWSQRQTRAIDLGEMNAIASEVEGWLSVSSLPTQPPPTSAAIDRGSTALGWQVVEVPRVFRYDGAEPTKQTMSRTMLPRAVAAGARVLPGHRVTRLIRDGSRVTGAVARAGRRLVRIRASSVFVCCGAIQTPALLLRSGITHQVGRTLKMHPTIKLAALFPDPLSPTSDVAMHQVKEFAPDITLGGSISRPSYAALSLADSWPLTRPRLKDVSRIAVYYASIRSDGGGRVRHVPGFDEPVVTYSLEPSDLSRLSRALVQLAELLFAAGAVEVFPSITGFPPVSHPRELEQAWRAVSRSRTNLMTIHLFSTVPMGDDRATSATDAYGGVWGIDGLSVNDASLLPDAPGVNPQGTIMTFAVRNARRWLDRS